MSIKVADAAPSCEDAKRVEIIDIRNEIIETNLKNDILSMLNSKKGQKKLPTLLLYSEEGLQLFEKITYLEEYYLTNAEMEALTHSASLIADRIPSGAILIEFGSGNLRKIMILLTALENEEKCIDYYALDVSITELKRTLSFLPRFKHVRFHGLLGTYNDGLSWLKSGISQLRPKIIISLGSSIGNFQPQEAVKYLNDFVEHLRPCDSVLIGLDACTNPIKVYQAYNDREGVTHEFLFQGLRNANQILKEEAFDLNDWYVTGEYVYDVLGGRHQAFYSPKKNVVIQGVQIREHERVQAEQSFKYTNEASLALWENCGLAEVDRWSATDVDYHLHMLVKYQPPFPEKASVYASSAIPMLKDWKSIWAAWDVVTQGMISHDELMNKPIKLRNALIFYLGHIPTFLDIQLRKATNELNCSRSTYYASIFERGIDPDVENPENCHSHSIIPDQWPHLADILDYQDQVRHRVEKLEDLTNITRDVGRLLWISFEHEIMHLETLLYMLLQSNKTLPPPHRTKPEFQKEAEIAAKHSVVNEWFKIPQQTIVIGMEETGDSSNLREEAHFGWDNEKPSRKITVPSFQAHGRPITVEEYAIYLYNTENSQIPASWAEDDARGTNGHVNKLACSLTSLTHTYIENKFVRTVYGLVPLIFALNWPVSASYDELAGCARWMGGRLPTFEEARSIYSHVDKLKQAATHRVKEGLVSSVTKDRVAEENSQAQALFVELDGANVGFQNWHPVAVTAGGGRLAGQSEMGGVWEWTSSTLEKHEGFEPMPLYPAYTADFFDGKHNIVLGGSWATHPRIAGRKSFVNWYQRNYPYAWAGARLVRDI